MSTLEPTRPNPGVRLPLIAICGTSTSTPEEDRIAEEVGRICAERNTIVVCGGLGGIMTSAAKGAFEAGGTTLGFLPGPNVEDANDYISIAVPTGLGEMRNGLIARSCIAMIAIGGGYGTLSEIGFMLRLGKPVTCLNSWSVAPPGSDDLEPAIHWASSVTDATEWVWSQI